MILDLAVFAGFKTLYAFSKGPPKMDNADSTEQPPQPQPSVAQSASTAGNNSPVMQANNGSTINSTINYGLTEDSLRLIREGMAAIERKKKDDLLKTFPMGYVLFTITERNQVVPNGSPIDKILAFDWTSFYALSISDGAITLHMPDMILTPPKGGLFVLSSCSMMVYRIPGTVTRGFRLGNYGVACRYLEDMDQSPVVALGIIEEPSPPPRKPTTQP
jgi:hypothetical protein